MKNLLFYVFTLINYIIFISIFLINYFLDIDVGNDPLLGLLGLTYLSSLIICIILLIFSEKNIKLLNFIYLIGSILIFLILGVIL